MQSTGHKTELFRSFGFCNCDRITLPNDKVDELINSRASRNLGVETKMFYDNSSLHCLAKIFANGKINVTHCIWSVFFEHLLFKRNDSSVDTYLDFLLSFEKKTPTTTEDLQLPKFEIGDPTKPLYKFQHINVCDFYFSRHNLYIPREKLEHELNAAKSNNETSDIDQHHLCNAMSTIIKASSWCQKSFKTGKKPPPFCTDLYKRYEKQRKSPTMNKVKQLMELKPTFDIKKSSPMRYSVLDFSFTHVFVKHMFQSHEAVNFRGFVFNENMKITTQEMKLFKLLGFSLCHFLS